MIRLTLELPWGWTFAAGFGRAGAELNADESAEPAGADSTHGDYTIADGPYSTDFRDLEPYYEEARTHFGFQS